MMLWREAPLRLKRKDGCMAAAIGLAMFGGGQALASGPVEVDAERLMSLSLQDLIGMPVVTASRQAETRDQTPAHIIVVTREQIRERRYKNLADLLEDMPGVDFQRGTKSSQFNQLVVQGYAGPNKLLVMLDGVRIGQPAGGNFPIAENFSLYHARQVEFLYGPAAALYGADAVAGVVNIITERANAGDGTWASAGAGNFGSREASFMAGLNTEQGLALSLGGHWQRSDRAPLDDFFPREFAKVDAVTFAGNTVVPAAGREDYQGGIGSRSFFARLDLSDRLTLGYYRNSFHSLTSTGDPPAMARYLEDSRWQTTIDTAYGKYRFQLAPAVDAELVVDYSRLEVDPRAKYNNTFNNYVDGYSYVRGERLAIEQNFNWRVDMRHRVQAGAGYQQYKSIETASLPSRYDTGRGPGDQGLLYPNTTLPFRIYEASFENFSAYAQLQSDWSEGFSTMAGVRFDHHSDYGSTFNPRLGAVLRASPQHVFKALYGEAFRSPAPEESLSSFGLFDGSRDGAGRYIGTNFRIPNFQLEPEKARTVSLVWDWRPSPSLNLVTHLYHSSIRNLVVNQPSTAVEAIPGAILRNPETKGNAGRQFQSGLDLMAQWRFRLGPDWTGDLWGSASWIQGRIDEGDGVDWEIPWVAGQKFKLGATLRYQNRFTITPKLYVMGDTTNGRKRPSSLLRQHCDRPMQAPERCATPGYTLMNLHLGWHRLFDGRATLWLDVYNLFDRRYYAAHGSGSRTFWDMPQQPRSWMASLEYRF